MEIVRWVWVNKVKMLLRHSFGLPENPQRANLAGGLFSFPLKCILNEFFRVLELLNSGHQLEKILYHQLFGIAYGTLNSSFFIRQGKLYYHFLVDQLIGPTGETGRELITRSRRGILVREYGRIIVKGKISEYSSPLIKGKSGRLCSYQRLVREIDLLLEKLRLEGDQGESIILYHTHPSLQFILKRKKVTQGLLHPLTPADLDCGRNIFGRYQMNTEVVAITLDGLQYSYSYQS